MTAPGRRSPSHEWPPEQTYRGARRLAGLSGMPRRSPPWPEMLASLLLAQAAHATEKPDGASDWRHGAYVDLAYPANFNTSAPHPWRSKVTTQRLSQFSPNLGMVYLAKSASAESPWGLELGAQAGYDANGQVPATSPIAGADVLRYVSRANLSVLAPVGNGLKLMGGLFGSFIGYESFHARDNINYTRSWMCDYSPYFLIGGGAQYPFSEQISGSFFIVSDYSYLTNVNSQPKYAGQFAWTISPRLKYDQNVFFGPEQTSTAFQYWRGFYNAILEWHRDDTTLAFSWDIGSEKFDQSPDPVQGLWTGAGLFSRWHIAGPWSVGLRPELYWDANGVMTGAVQFIKAITTTLEYRLVEGDMNGRVRLEYRYDNSTGAQGGFYGAGGVNGPLVSGQSTLFFALLLSYDH